MRDKKIYIITGPSAVGKTTVAELVLKKLKNLQKIVTYTTRVRRKGERQDRDYNFISVAEFKKKIKKKEFFEWAINYGNYYGNSKKDIEKIQKKGKEVLLVIDIKGVLTIKKKWSKSIAIFILPESLKQLERRFKKRADTTKKAVQERLKIAKWELSQAPKCDFWMVNRENKADLVAKEVVEILKNN